MSIYEIKELSDSDWRGYKSIRLSSLQDSPNSFASTYEREASFSTEQWQARLRISSSIHDALALGAVVDESFVGLLSCVIHKPDTSSAHLYQMWVAPEYRGKGVGMALVDRIKSWACQRDVENLVLSVTTINTEAIALYKKLGFYSVGDSEQLRPGSKLKSQTMEITLNREDI